MTGKVGTRLIRRAAALLAAVILIFGALSARILILQTNGFERYQDKVIEQMTTESPAAAGRGEIYDINGKLLATNVTTYRVFCPHPPFRQRREHLMARKPTPYP